MKKLKLHIAVKVLLYWYIFIFFSTEILSIFHLLERLYILLSEIFFWAIFIFFNYKEILHTIRKINFRSKSLLIISILFFLTFVQGFLSAPNSTDSLVYQLPRMMYWVQEKTLYQDVMRSAHEYIPPFAQYVLLHLYLVFNSDRFLFFSQWFAYVITVVTSYIIARCLGADQKISNIVALLVATIPVAALQATSVKIEMVVTVLVVTCTYLALRLQEDNIFDYILLSIVVGLGVFTKQTFLIYSVIPLGILLIKFLKIKKKKYLILLVMLMIILIIQARFVFQNLSLFDNRVVLDRDYSGYVNQNITLTRVISNLIKNTMLHIPVPLYTKHAESIILSLHRLLKIDVNDCSTTFCDPAFRFRIVPIVYPQEDVSSNILHLLLIVVAGIVLFTQIVKKRVRSSGWLLYVLAVLSYVVFSSVLKWQPFHSRFHIPFFVLGVISSAILLSKSNAGLFFLKIVVVLSVLLALLLISLNVLRPYVSYSLFLRAGKIPEFSLTGLPESFLIKPYKQQYFNARSYWYKPYLSIMSLITQKDIQSDIAFYLMDEFEYPLWVLLKENNIKTRIVPYSQSSDQTLIISTTEKPFLKKEYFTECIKTDIEYGYVCVSSR